MIQNAEKNIIKPHPFRERQKGASMIEYVLLAALIALVAIIAITQVGTKVNAKFNTIQNAL